MEPVRVLCVHPVRRAVLRVVGPRPARTRAPLPFTLDANVGLVTSRTVLARWPALRSQFEAAQKLHERAKAAK